MKIGLISNEKFKSYSKDISLTINSLGHKAIILNRSNDLLKNCDALTEAIKKGRIDRGITIDDYGTIPFMFIAKTKGIVVAQIADEHSAFMTCAHNNATILAFGGEISTLHQIKNMVKAFISSQYDGGRHKVRIDMLDTMLEGQ
ncbi:MAG: RpiB/LacA/LacB family sugar-phosphate isomerase [Mycoplasmataceae bacterium]|jgi:galactose-6-phosphate isomerase|nr:RpiB/LacA/LacB family sugar-phosphate isomerase [Mycoplasmataceae bacterium]